MMNKLKKAFVCISGVVLLSASLVVSAAASEIDEKSISISDTSEESVVENPSYSDNKMNNTDSNDIYDNPDGTGITSEDFVIEEYTVKGLSDIGKTKDDIVIPDGVLTIADNAFKNESFRSVIIPESVTQIGSGAFNGCANLQRVDIQSTQLSPRKVMGGAFKGCKINELTFSSKLTYLPANLFSNATFDDYDLVIPASIEEIDYYCFRDATGIRSLTFAGNKITKIGDEAFKNLPSIGSVTIPESVTNIGSGAFSGCSNLQKVDIQSTLLSPRQAMGGAFVGCKINELTFSNKLAYLPANLFSNATFDDYDLVIPAGIEEIDYYCFRNATGIRSLTFAGNKITKIGSEAFKNLTSIESITIPASVTTIGDNAFDECTGLKGVLRIPASITKLGSSPFSNCKFECIVNNSSVSLKLPLIDHQTWLNYYTGEKISSVANGIAILEGSTIDPGEDDPSTKYTVTYKANGETIGEVPIDGNEYTRGQTAVVMSPGNLKKPESKFKCWCLDPDGNGPTYLEGATIAVNDNIFLYAIWEDLSIDYWGFENSDNNFGLPSNGYGISRSDYDRLVSGLPKTMAGVMKYFLNPDLSKKNGSWEGSCYGMSTTTALVKNGRNTVSDFTHRASDTILNGVSTADESFANGTDAVGYVESSINFYHFQQVLPEYQSFKKEYINKSEKEQIDGIALLAKATQQDNIPIQIGFGWQLYGAKFGHAIIGRGYRELDPDEKLYAQYPHCILTYDCSNPDSIGNDSGSNIYFNDEGGWCIPSWNVTRPGNAEYIVGTRDVSVTAPVDFLTGTYNKKAQMPTQILYDSNSGFSMMIGNDSVKIQGANIVENTGNLKVDILPETIGLDSAGTDRYTAYLPEISEYTVKADKLEHELLTDECLIKATALSGGTAVLGSTGEASIESESSGNLSLEVIDNNANSALSQEFALDVSDAKQLAEKKDINGIIVESDNLNSLKIVSGDDSISIDTKESIGDKVLVKEDNGKISVFEDKNKDGVYDDEVRTEDDTKRSNTIVVGQKINLHQTCFADVTDTISRYAVSNTSLAGVSKEMLSGKKPGTVTVYAQRTIGRNSYENIAECEVTVLNKPKLKFTKYMTYVDQTVNGSDFFLTEDIRTYGATYWESNKPGIVEVIDSENGTLKAKSSGTAKITAYFGEKGKQGTFKISANLAVKIPSYPKAVYSLQTGAKIPITMKNVTGALDPEWVTSEEGIARVSAQRNSKGAKTGKAIVEGLSYGDTTLTATIDGQNYTCTIRVTAPEINKKAMTLKVGKQGTVSLKKTKIKKTDVVWNSDNPEVATVDANGKITALKSGNATIYTETGGIRNECQVTVP